MNIFFTGMITILHQPELSIGVGDSLSDLNFMNKCDYRIFPRYSQIERFILDKDPS